MEEVREQDVDRQVVQEVGESVVLVAECAIQQGTGPEAEIDLAEAVHKGLCISLKRAPQGNKDKGQGKGAESTYVGEVNFERKASSTDVRTPWSRSIASREKRVSVGIVRRDCVMTKML